MCKSSSRDHEEKGNARKCNHEDAKTRRTKSTSNSLSLRAFVVAFAPLVVAFALLLQTALIGQAPPKQAVIETSLGTFVIELTPETAPNQVSLFLKLAQEGAYD